MWNIVREIEDTLLHTVRVNKTKRIGHISIVFSIKKRPKNIDTNVMHMQLHGLLVKYGIFIRKIVINPCRPLLWDICCWGTHYFYCDVEYMVI